MKIIADANIPFVTECFSSVGQVETVPGREMTAEIIHDADVLLVRSVTEVGESLLSGSKVRFVATATIGFEHVDTEYLAKSNIGFASAPGSNANSVAEFMVAALLSLAGKHNIKLEGKSIGIIGVGNVGGNVEKKAKALGMKAYLNDPPLQRETSDSRYLPIEALFGCDFVTLHTPLTFEGADKTFHLADGKFFESLKPGCGFINTARGGVMNTPALKAAIKSGRLGPVVLDVWENEPNIDVDLLRMVGLATPHIAGYSLDGKVAGTIMVYQAMCKYFGLKPEKTANHFLPEPQVPEIAIEDESGDEQEIIRQTVQQVYSINRDDSNTREIAMVPKDQRGKFFDGLRRTYPERREFQNTTVLVKDRNRSLAKKLDGIGFAVS
ncbi:MAG: 4-phosphoerythronate dehydrogenase [Planctomycetota bacterium]|jgi:erythronate-4-phosphate dehydrogenase